jgi:hypothetical protein
VGLWLGWNGEGGKPSTPHHWTGGGTDSRVGRRVWVVVAVVAEEPVESKTGYAVVGLDWKEVRDGTVA